MVHVYKMATLAAGHYHICNWIFCVVKYRINTIKYNLCIRFLLLLTNNIQVIILLLQSYYDEKVHSLQKQYFSYYFFVGLILSLIVGPERDDLLKACPIDESIMLFT